MFFDLKNGGIITFYLRKQRAKKVLGDNIMHIAREINGVRELEKNSSTLLLIFLEVWILHAEKNQ